MAPADSYLSSSFHRGRFSRTFGLQSRPGTPSQTRIIRSGRGHLSELDSGPKLISVSNLSHLRRLWNLFSRILGGLFDQMTLNQVQLLANLLRNADVLRIWLRHAMYFFSFKAKKGIILSQNSYKPLMNTNISINVRYSKNQLANQA